MAAEPGPGELTTLLVRGPRFRGNADMYRLPMHSFPKVQIHAERLDIREYGTGDAGLVREVLRAGQPEALPPGAPAQPEGVAGWLADGVHAARRDGTGVHLMMLDRAGNRIVGSIALFHADWEVRSAEIGYGVSATERGKGYATEALVAVSRWAQIGRAHV